MSLPAGGPGTRVVIVERYKGATACDAVHRQRDSRVERPLPLTEADARAWLARAEQHLRENQDHSPERLRPWRRWRDSLRDVLLEHEQGKERVLKAKLQRTHPDHGGDPEEFKAASTQLRRLRKSTKRI